MKFDDLKFMSIGSNCANLGCVKNRIKGPVDNLAGVDRVICFENLFEGDEILKELSAEPIITDRTPNFEGDSDKYYIYKHYMVCHNDPRTEKYKIEFERRLRVLQDFYKHIQEADHYFVYSLGPSEIDRSKNTLQTDNNLKDIIKFLEERELLKKVIFIGSRNVKSKSYWNFYCSNFREVFPEILYVEIEDLNLWSSEATQKQFQEKVSTILNLEEN